MAYKFTEKRNNIQEQTTYVLYMIVSSYFHKSRVMEKLSPCFRCLQNLCGENVKVLSKKTGKEPAKEADIMSTALDSLSHKVQRAAVGTMVDVALAHVNKDRQKAIAEMVDVAKQFYGDSFSEETYEHAHAVLADPDSKWSKLINCVLSQTDPNVARTTALNLGYEAFFRGTKTIRENRVKYRS